LGECGEEDINEVISTKKIGHSYFIIVPTYNSRMAEAGRHLWRLRSSNPTPGFKARSTRAGCSEPCTIGL